jgi:hypothetical protein
VVRRRVRDTLSERFGEHAQCPGRARDDLVVLLVKQPGEGIHHRFDRPGVGLRDVTDDFGERPAMGTE